MYYVCISLNRTASSLIYLLLNTQRFTKYHQWFFLVDTVLEYVFLFFLEVQLNLLLLFMHLF